MWLQIALLFLIHTASFCQNQKIVLIGTHCSASQHLLSLSTSADFLSWLKVENLSWESSETDPESLRIFRLPTVLLLRNQREILRFAGLIKLDLWMKRISRFTKIQDPLQHLEEELSAVFNPGDFLLLTDQYYGRNAKDKFDLLCQKYAEQWKANPYLNTSISDYQLKFMQESGDLAFERLLEWLENPAQSPFETSSVASHLRTSCASIKSLSNYQKRILPLLFQSDSEIKFAAAYCMESMQHFTAAMYGYKTLMQNQNSDFHLSAAYGISRLYNSLGMQKADSDWREKITRTLGSTLPPHTKEAKKSAR